MGKIFENYMEDVSIPQEKKNYAIQQLNSWLREDELDNILSQKYPWKYDWSSSSLIPWQSWQPQIPNPIPENKLPNQEPQTWQWSTIPWLEVWKSTAIPEEEKTWDQLIAWAVQWATLWYWPELAPEPKTFWEKASRTVWQIWWTLIPAWILTKAIWAIWLAWKTATQLYAQLAAEWIVIWWATKPKWMTTEQSLTTEEWLKERWQTALEYWIAWPVWSAIVSNIWKWLSKIWKIAYKSAFTPSVQEAEKTLAYEAWRSKFKPITTAETAIRKWLAWTEKQIWIQAMKEWDKIFKEVVNPALEKSKQVITKDELFSTILEDIKSTVEPWRKANLEAAFKKIQWEYSKIWDQTIPQAQALKRWLAEFTPQKAYKWEEISNAYNQIRADMAKTIRKLTYDKIKTEQWLNIAQEYMDYWNLEVISKLWVKALTDPYLKWWWWWFIWWLADKLLTPIKTIWWKVLYKVWDSLEFIWPKWLKKVNDILDVTPEWMIYEKVPNN